MAGFAVHGASVLLLLLVVAGSYVQAKGDIGDFEHHEEAAVTERRAAAYYTDMMVQGVGKEPKACSERVLASRRAAVANGKKISIGVEPTVGLGAALLIFLGVGVFAVVIAQTFQMVRGRKPKLLLLSCQDYITADFSQTIQIQFRRLGLVNQRKHFCCSPNVRHHI